jgi:PST family polysaccharide transporter
LLSMVAKLTIEDNQLKRRSVRGGAALLVAQVGKFLIKVVTQIVIARLLLPSDYGLIAMVAPIFGLVQLIADLGLGEAIIQRSELTQHEVSALFWFGLIINSALAGATACTAPLIGWIYQEPRLIPVTLALAAVMPISALTIQPAALLSRDLRFGMISAIDVLAPGVGFILALAVHGLRYWALVISMAGERIFGAALIWYSCEWRPSRPAFGSSAWSLVRIGTNISAFSLAQYVTTTADNILLALTRGQSALGIYDKAYKIVTLPLSQLVSPAHRVAVPLLVHLASNPNSYRRTYVAMLQVLMMAGIPGLLCVLVSADPLMRVLLGSHWSGIAPVVSWCCIGGLASPIYTSTYWLFVSQGRSSQQLTYGVITAGISVASFVGGLHWGPSGVMAGAGLSFLFLSTPLTCRAATRYGPVSSIDLARGLLPIAVGGASAGFLLLTLSRILPGGLLIAVELPVSYVTFFGVLICFPSGLGAVRQAWQLKAMLREAEPQPTISI